ncbi:glycosyltransferase family 4 protein [Methanothermobacter sp.]|uniref:glycosyltransferase family 4 protein n=1 Tax=Methanothermobacter sp. TaxID=1884223 RepID=UPI0026220CA8|nr:glycosyltransferase family 4 protein [Methanothermobacter sp.]MDI9617669.1 glycosyltransferase family 4 protein [Methanothermobacter sp.]
MKICLISSLYPPQILGGAEIVVEKLAKELVKGGNEVFVITTNNKKEPLYETLNGVKVYRLPLNIYSITEFHRHHMFKRLLWQLIDLINIKAYKEVKKILKKEEPHILHLHNYRGLSPLVFRALRNLKIPLIFTAHDYSPICIRSNLLNGNGEICYRKNPACKLYNAIQSTIMGDKVDVVTAPSKFVLDKLEAEGLFRNAKKIVIPNPIEYTPKRYKKTYDTIDILFVGSLSKHKGPDILIKSFKKVDGDNLRLHIVGSGPMEGELRKLAEDDNRIKFHGFLRGEELQSLYRMANVSVLPSIWYEAFGMVIIESFTNSVPVVASNIGGIPEIIVDNYNGFLFKPKNVDELSGILENLINPSILRNLEKGAYQSSKLFDVELTTKEIRCIYNEVVQTFYDEKSI